MDILEKIFENKPEIREQYNYLLPHYKTTFKNKKDDKDQINRVSFVSEIRFGYYLRLRFENLKYDSNILGKTPDWIIDQDSEKIIFEVKQLNPTNAIFLDRIKQVKEDKYNGVDKFKTTFSVRDIFPYLIKIMEKEKAYRELVSKENYKLIICVNFTNLTTEFFTDKDLIDYLDLKNNYKYFNQEIDYLDRIEFNHFCDNVAGFLVMPRFGADIFFIENKICKKPVSNSIIETLNRIEL